MQFNIHAKDLTLSPEQKDYIESKIKKLVTFSAHIDDESTEIRVEVHEAQRHGYKQEFAVQVTFYVPHAIIRAEDEGETVEGAIDIVEEKLKKQIERYKGKIHRRDNQGKWVARQDTDSKPTEEFELPKIIRRKRISKFMPMTEEEAIEHLELVGHNFFLFDNLETKRVSVVYKRKDGFYGVIEPHIGEDFEHRNS